MIRFRCTQCGKKLKADEEIIGKKVKCTRCEHVEVVPESDNLAKPNQPKQIAPKSRLKTTMPQSGKAKGPSDLIAGDEPIELFGHSASGIPDGPDFEKQFDSAPPRKSNLRRNMILGLLSLILIGGIAFVLNLDKLLDAKRKLSTDYEDLPEVVFYRNKVMKLEKSRRMMWIAGQSFIATKLGTDEEKQELADYNASIESRTTKSDVLEQVEALFRAGEDIKARALLVKTAVELDELSKKVDEKTQQYQDMAY